jgi:predicted NAD/FAD-dependent oxidoreductase
MPVLQNVFSMNQSQNQSDVLVLGAGISGLLCATELQRAGVSVQVLDKGRGVGGRMATRRMGNARLDHGAQFFTVREAAFGRYVDEWLAADVIRPWFQHGANDTNAAGYSRYCGRNGMTDVAKHLCESLQVHRSQKGVTLNRDGALWHLVTEAGERYDCRFIVVTAPVPQALDLLDTSGLD